MVYSLKQKGKIKQRKEIFAYFSRCCACLVLSISQELITVFQALLTIMLVNASASANKLGIFGNQKIRNKLFSAGSQTFSTFLAGAVIYLARQRTCLSKVHLMILGHNFSHIKLCCPLVWRGVHPYQLPLDKTRWYCFPKLPLRVKVVLSSKASPYKSKAKVSQAN